MGACVSMWLTANTKLLSYMCSPFCPLQGLECKTVVNKLNRRKSSDCIKFLEFGGVSEVHSQLGVGINHWQGN